MTFQLCYIRILSSQTFSLPSLSGAEETKLKPFNEDDITKREHFPGEKHFILASECNLEFL